MPRHLCLFSCALILWSGCAVPKRTGFVDYCALSHRELSEAELSVFRSVEDCAQLKALPPRIIYVDSYKCRYYIGWRCITGEGGPCSKNPLEYCEIEGKYIPWCSLVVLPGGLARREVVWHEFLHHLLDKNGRDFESVHHKAPEFKKCEKPLSQKK